MMIIKVAALILATAVSALSQENVSTNNALASSATTHTAALQAMVGERTNPIALPKVIAGSAISATEVLRKALDARGGAAAASRIVSFRAKGTIDPSNSLLAASPVEYIAKRPSQFRMLIDLRLAAGSDLGRLDQGFDGKNGWKMQPGGPVRMIEGKMLQEQREGAEFFAWYMQPDNYASAEVLGEAMYAGKKCYALKLVTQSGHEVMQYYDTATFLLAGLIETVETEAGPTLRKLSFDDYRAFGGFKMPTLLALQNQSAGGSPPHDLIEFIASQCNAIEFSSIEVNAVKESAVKMPADERKKIAAAYKDPVYSQYERDLQALLPKASKRAGKEVIKVEPLSEQFTVPRKLAIKGTPYELGLTIGYIGKQTEARLPMSSDKELNRKTIELYQRIYPQQLEIIRGVAEVYETPVDKIDAGAFEYAFTTSLWCGLLKYGRFNRATEFQKYTDFASHEHCSAASCYANGRQLVGRNFDNPSDKPHYFTTMELAGGYKVMGHTVYDITSWFVDGINEKGLSLCVTSASGEREPYPDEPAVLMGHMCQILMQTCASVEEALKLLRTVRVWFPDEVNHWLLADASGKAVVVEWNPKNHKLLVFEQPHPYELLTNTPLELGEEAVLKECWRYCKAKPMLEAGVQDAAGMFEVMKAVRVTSGASRTLWTTVMDLNARTFEVRYFKEFERKYEFKF